MSAAVVGGGVCCAAGLTRRASCFILRAGFPAIAEAPLANAEREAITMGYVPTLDEAWIGEDRLGGLASGALHEAVAPVKDHVIDVLIGVDLGLANEAAALRSLERIVHRAVPELGEMSIRAVGDTLGPLWDEANDRLERRKAKAVIVGGVHTDYDPSVIAHLEASGRLFSRDNLDARMPGEAAAFLTLARPNALPLAPLAHLVGWGRAPDPVRPDNDAPAFVAKGLTEASRQALASVESAGWVLNDLTTEMWRLYEWQAVFTRIRRKLDDPPTIESPAQRLGYLGAASLPLLAAMATTGWEHGYAPSSTALLTAANDFGERAALTLQSAQPTERSHP